MNDLLIEYLCKDGEIRTIFLETALLAEDLPELLKVIGMKRKKHEPTGIHKVTEVE
jgi:hypothetical protein